MSKKVTNWFPASVKPTIPGVYEMRDLPAPFHYWDGQHWLHIAGSTPSALSAEMLQGIGRMSDHTMYPKNREWRGLAFDPQKES